MTRKWFTVVPAREILLQNGAAWFVLTAALTVAVYGQVLRAGFVFDDELYLLTNPALAAGLTLEGLRWALTSFYQANWHPVTWLSHLTDVTLFGLRPAGHHAVNLLVHLLNTALLARVLVVWTGSVRRSWLVAALFALHPLNVESVAWVAERKNLLSTLFFLLALLAYRRAVARPRLGAQAQVAVFLALGLMAKPMLVTFPFVLLLLDWWPLGRLPPGGVGAGAGASIGRLLREKAPLFILAGASIAITIAAQRAGGAIATLAHHTLSERVGNALLSYTRYLGKAFWPADLAVFYPYPVGGPLSARVVAAGLLLAVICVAVLARVRDRPWLAVGWFWFLGTLVPVIGLVQVGSQALADRYAYLTLPGLFIVVAWESAQALRGRRRCLGIAATALLCATLAALTARQAGYWRDQRTLFTRALAVTEGNWLAHYNVGVVLMGEGNAAAAAERFRLAIALLPTYAQAHANLGAALVFLGQPESALWNLREALRLKPGFREAQNNLALALSRTGRLQEAEQLYREAIEHNPRDAALLNNLGAVYFRMGMQKDAGRFFRKALAIDPGNQEAARNLRQIGQSP